MSDTSQGPGWWQASDSRWYPPAAHPGAPGAAAGSSQSPYPVVVNFQLTEAELSRALWWRVLHRPGLYVQLLVGTLFLLFGVLQVALTDSSGDTSSPQIGVYFIIFGVVYLLTLGVRVAVGPRRAWQKNPALRGPQTMAFSDDGTQSRSIFSEARSQWAVYSRTDESSKAYLLQAATRRTCVVVPKRAFASAPDELTFRALVERHTEARLRRAAEPTGP